MLNSWNLKILLLLCLVMHNSTKVHGSVLISDYQMSRMIELSARKPFCNIYSDRGDIQRMLMAADPVKVRHIPRESVSALEGVCHEATGVSGEIHNSLGFIYPGTKWCGPGTLAADFNDLGRYTDEDKCCREHDLCPNTLSSGECRRGLCNKSRTTRSHCDCDARFRRCLQTVNTETANTLGAVFFNVVQVTCFRERRPCTDWQRVGYNQTFGDELCSRWKFRPSEKYVPNDKYSF